MEKHRRSSPKPPTSLSLRHRRKNIAKTLPILGKRYCSALLIVDLGWLFLGTGRGLVDEPVRRSNFTVAALLSPDVSFRGLI
jgi:hypothetical protein